MVETITPVVHGSRKRWAVAVLAHTLGATLAAATFGLLLGAGGAMLGAPWGAAGPVLVAAIALAYALSEAVGGALPVPQAKRQVPEWWRTFFGPIPAAGLYGAGLGIGFLTYLPSGLLLAASVAAIASGAPAAAAVVLGAFGFARGASVIVVGRARSSEDVARVAERVASVGASWVPRAASIVALLAVAATAASAAAARSDADPAGAAAAILALVMAWAAVAKIVRPADWRRTLRAHDLGRLTALVAVAVPLVELCVAGLAFAQQRRAAGWLGLALLVTFSAAAIRARLRSGAAVPCGCFGGVKARPLRTILARNGILAVIATLALVGSDGRRPHALSISSAEALPVALLLAGLASLTMLALRVREVVQGRG